MKDESGDQTIEIVLQGEPNHSHERIRPTVYGSTRSPEINECDFHEDPPPLGIGCGWEPGLTGQYPAGQLRCCATHRYPVRIREFIPGTLDAHKSGRAHENSRATARMASTPEYCVPSPDTKRIVDSNSARERPSSTPTRGSCKGATARPRRLIGAVSHIAMPVQNLHSASKTTASVPSFTVRHFRR